MAEQELFNSKNTKSSVVNASSSEMSFVPESPMPSLSVSAVGSGYAADEEASNASINGMMVSWDGLVELLSDSEGTVAQNDIANEEEAIGVVEQAHIEEAVVVNGAVGVIGGPVSPGPADLSGDVTFQTDEVAAAMGEVCDDNDPERVASRMLDVLLESGEASVALRSCSYDGCVGVVGTDSPGVSSKRRRIE